MADFKLQGDVKWGRDAHNWLPPQHSTPLIFYPPLVLATMPATENWAAGATEDSGMEPG